MEDDSFEHRTRPRRRRAIIVCALVLLVGFLLAWFFVPPKTNTQPVSFQRDESGNWQEAGGDDSAGAMNLEFHAGSLTSTNSVSSGTVTSHSSPANFPSRHVMVLNHSEHLVMQRVGDALLKELRERGQFDRVEYFPYGHVPPVGELAPDLYLVLGLDAIDESGLLQRDLKATVRFTLGTMVVRSSHTVSDSSIPPRVSVFANSSLDHTSSMSGVESSGAEYRLQGADIAKRIGKSIAETIDGLREKFVFDCDFPRELYGDWIKAPQFSFLQDADVSLLTSLRGLCLHNQTVWKMASVDDPAALLGRIHAELTDLGWEGKATAPNESGHFYMRMKMGTEVLEVFPAQENGGFGTSIAIAATETDGELASSVTIYARYRHYINEKDRQGIFAQLLAAPKPNMKQLVSLNRLGSDEQQRQLMKLIQNSPPQLPEAWLMLARQHASQKQATELEQALRNAYVLSWLLDNTDTTERQIKNLCKKHKLKEKEFCKVEFEQIKSLGLPTVSKESPMSESIIRSGESAVAIVGNEQEWQVVSVKLTGVQQGDGLSLFDTRISRRSPTTRSWTTGTSVYTTEQHRRLTHDGMTAMVVIKEETSGSLRVRIEYAPE